MDDPRERALVGWEAQVPLYDVRVPVQGVVSLHVGVADVGPKRIRTIVDVLTSHELDAAAVHQVVRRALAALVVTRAESRSWAASAALGGQDVSMHLPKSMPPPREAHCFWMFNLEAKRPVLAVRTHFQEKEILKRIFSKEWGASDSGQRSRFGWRADGKVWWINAELGYPRVLGRMRREGWKLKWIDRGPPFPPAPPVEEVPFRVDELNEASK